MKVVRGTDQPCRRHGEDLEYDPVEGDFPPPDWLNADAQNYWRRIVPILQKNRLLTEADLEALEIMCLLYGEVKKIGKAGMEPKGSTVTQLRLYQAAFGVTPISRIGIKPAGKERENPFSRNGSKKK